MSSGPCSSYILAYRAACRLRSEGSIYYISCVAPRSYGAVGGVASNSKRLRLHNFHGHSFRGSSLCDRAGVSPGADSFLSRGRLSCTSERTFTHLSRYPAPRAKRAAPVWLPPFEGASCWLTGHIVGEHGERIKRCTTLSRKTACSHHHDPADRFQFGQYCRRRRLRNSENFSYAAYGPFEPAVVAGPVSSKHFNKQTARGE